MIGRGIDRQEAEISAKFLFAAPSSSPQTLVVIGYLRLPVVTPERDRFRTATDFFT